MQGLPLVKLSDGEQVDWTGRANGYAGTDSLKEQNKMAVDKGLYLM